MSNPARNRINSVRTAFEIIESLQDLDGAGVSDLASHLDVPKSTAHNYLSTLEEMGYLTKEDGQYHVGVRFLGLGAYVRNRRKIYEIAKPEVERLAEETTELANLLVEEHGTGTYLQRASGSRAVKVEAHVGTNVPLHCTALGKCILAHLPESRVESILEQVGFEPVTPNTVTSREELYSQLDRIRECGYALDDEERIEGLRCVAAPILSNDDRVLGSISVSGPSNRIQGDRFRETLPNKVLETVNVIELNVTYS
ncbi:IclR family transcriptional regulator [Halopenitus sp. H-Gu1]|uniref:IclR family transcriptional regulator n=1 Tax=Halopenitus sp. H-Gu1 TaxID=3242697 RepID=UPI00359E8864